MKASPKCLLSFDGGVLEPQSFIGIVDGLKGLGFEFLGGNTERGFYKIVDVYDSVEEWIRGEREDLGFINLYWMFFRRDEPPSGLLVLTPECIVFMPGFNRPDDCMWFRLVCVSRKEREEVNEVTSEHGLKWWGEPAHPILYRHCKPSLENAKSFWLDTLEFLEEVGYSMI